MKRLLYILSVALVFSACDTPIQQPQKVHGHIVDAVNHTIFDGEIHIKDGKITAVTPCKVSATAPFIMPGFVDSHVHIESSMMVPTEFARIAMRHGTVAAVCDPHEIANVLDVAGVEMMIDNAKHSPFHFAFGAPSCVPSCNSSIETSGEAVDRYEVEKLLKRDEVYCLAEMMNFRGVLSKDPVLMAKIAAAKKLGKPVDGHAPGLIGEQRRKYAESGISTDHECTSLEEARDAISVGMYIMIREGSAAKNYKPLSPLIAEFPEAVMFCTDDSHPTDFVNGHINRMVARALKDGYRLMDILQAACVNPVKHYNLPVGLLQEGDPADFILVSDTTSSMSILATYIDGELVSNLPSTPVRMSERYQICNAKPIILEDIEKHPHAPIHVIVATDESLLTGHEIADHLDDGIQKIIVYNRYTKGAKPAVGYIRGFDMKHGAIAQTIAHDCHNIVAIGTSDRLILDVVNRLIEMKGGIVVTDGVDFISLPLPVGGLMSLLPGEALAIKNIELEAMVTKTGCIMHSPFITLGCMALPVIPELKLTDKGLFDVTTSTFVRQ